MEQIAFLFYKLQVAVDPCKLLELFRGEEVFDNVVKVGLCMFYHRYSIYC